MIFGEFLDCSDLSQEEYNKLEEVRVEIPIDNLSNSSLVYYPHSSWMQAGPACWEMDDGTPILRFKAFWGKFAGIIKRKDKYHLVYYSQFK